MLETSTWLARCSLILLGVMALTTAGCLVSDTPEFKAPERTPPFLTNLKPSPETVQIVTFRPGTRPEDQNYLPPPPISFDVKSEDRGEPIQILFFLDFEGINSPTPGIKLKGDTIPAGTMQQAKVRPYSFEFTPTSQVSRECHTLSVVASHEFELFSAKPVTPGDVEIRTWFYQVGIEPSKADPGYKACKPNPNPVDAGNDAQFEGGLL